RALVMVLSKLWDESGKVTIPGFYDGIQMPEKEEMEKYNTEFDMKEYQRNFGVKAFSNEENYSPIESNWFRPTLEINGISGGYTGSGFKTVIPSVARAKVSCRLVPGQDPKKIQKGISDFLKSHIAKGIALKIEHHQDAPAFRSSYDSEIAHTAAKAYEEVFQKPCRFVLGGGSIPIVVDLVKASEAEATVMGFGLPEDNIHAPNEHFGLDRFEMGFLTMGRMIAMFSDKQS
ncbi:MAG TPA: M20/M25/M40 family metallo-hydrolase, partial [Rhabdochlamydiaceae bacterium]|nr:M20/M25/M40 family metallo-hydrolase [Rhabdochlamydiaceae bacterium]